MIDLDYSERAGFLVGKSARMADWRHQREKREFKKLCDAIYQRNYLARPEVRLRRNTARRVARVLLIPTRPVIARQTCGVEFVCIRRAPGHLPRYCGRDCVLAARRARRPSTMFACSACPKCRSNLTEAGVGTAPAAKHRIVAGRCEHCRRPVEVLVAVGVKADRLEAADA